VTETDYTRAVDSILTATKLAESQAESVLAESRTQMWLLKEKWDSLAAEVRALRSEMLARPAGDERPAYLVNAERLIYCIEGSRAVIALREGARKPGLIEFAGDVEDIYEAEVRPGQYVTCNKRGLFRLGAAPADSLTAVLA
jgi:hypothetical protein